MKNQSILKQEGYTLIELMIGMVIGLIVLSGVLFGYLQIVNATQSTIASTRLNTELSNVSGIISGELRRSGYSAATDGGVYQQGVSSIDLPSASCALYSYDVSENGVLDSVEQRGFMLSNNEILRGISVTACDGASGWSSLTDSSVISVTNLNFACQGCTASSAVRQITVNITASDGPVNDFQASREYTILLPNNVGTD
jgi:prepilin-type N-terminal cleavage/methylation domain-containing protein